MNASRVNPTTCPPRRSCSPVPMTGVGPHGSAHRDPASFSATISSQLYPSSHSAPNTPRLAEQQSSRRNTPSTFSALNVSFTSTHGGAASSFFCGGVVSRCKVCHSLPGSCSCSISMPTMDREARKRNLEVLIERTPFNRTRSVREWNNAVAQLSGEESRKRERIDAMMRQSFIVICELFDDECLSMHCLSEALAVIASIISEQEQAFLRIKRAKMHEAPLPYFTADEAFYRKEVERYEILARQRLADHFSDASFRMDLVCVENQRRAMLVTNERDQLGQLLGAFALGLGTLESTSRAQQAFLSSVLLQRSHVEMEWRQGTQHIEDLMAQSVAMVDGFYRTRHQRYLDAEHASFLLLQAFKSGLGELYELAQEDLLGIEHRQRQLEEAISRLERAAREARTVLMDDQFEVYQHLLYDMKAERDALVTAAAKRTADQNALIRDVVEFHRDQSQQALNFLSDLHAEAVASRVELQAWMSQCVRDRALFWMTVEEWFAKEWDHCTCEFLAMYDAMSDAGLALEALLETHANERVAFVANAVELHLTLIPREENAVRVALWDRMQDEEEALDRWYDACYQEQTQVGVDELVERQAMQQEEDRHWLHLIGRMETSLDKVAKRVAAQMDARRSVYRSALAVREGIEREEGESFSLIVGLEEQSRLCAFNDAWIRVLQSLELEESNRRHDMVIYTHRWWASVATQEHTARRPLERQRQAQWEEAVRLMLSDEASVRTEIECMMDRLFALLRFDCEKDAEVANDNASTRIENERRQITYRLTEDPRLYDAQELPLMESEMNFDEFRRSIREDWTDSEGRVSCRFSTAPGHNTAQVPTKDLMEREFVGGCLNCSTQRLSSEAVHVMADLFQRVNDMRSAAEADVSRLKETHHRLNERIAKTRRLREHEKDRVKMFRERLVNNDKTWSVELTQRRRKLQQDRAAVAKAEADCAALEQSVKLKVNELEDLRQKIRDQQRYQPDRSSSSAGGSFKGPAPTSTSQRR